ncbi:MAG TPA: ABC transporter ATP-binding protein [Verrucomicrobiales bacterium]|nr:ABC transporter ATP-binding protein [Verrucomicrobiales bacterium]
MNAAISVRNLHRYFGSIKAVDDVSFEIPPGQVVGFVGANGAGKTTTMRIVATLEYPTAGEVSIAGRDVVQYPAEVRRIIGWMPDSYGAYDHMTVLEYLDFYARAMGFRGTERDRRVQEVMAFTDLVPLSGRLINKLSKGMGQRLCLGRSLIHDPEVLIMDEPAAGLDPRARVELKQLIRLLADEGKTIFISSHILGELQEMCDYLLFINRGKIIHYGTAEALLEAAGDRVIIQVQLAGESSRLADWAAVTPHVRYVSDLRGGGRIEVDHESPDGLAELLRRMVNAGLPVIDFHRERRRLEDAFIQIVGNMESAEAALLLQTVQASGPSPAPVPPPPLPAAAPGGADSPS